MSHPTRHAALLRGVNLAGHKQVAMADLRAFFTTLGFEDVRTVVQSGNVVFGGGRRAAAALERLLEREAATRLGLETAFFVRAASEWEPLVARNPFPDAARDDPAHLLVVFLKDAPSAARARALAAAITGRERVRVIGRELYVVYPDGIGRSRLTTAVIDKTLDTRGTARNWNTVRKLGALLAD